MDQGGHNYDRDERFIRETGVEAEIAALAEPVLEEMGFWLIRIVQSGRDGGTVQIMADRRSGGITIDDCARISRALSPLLEVSDPVQGSYRLEVSTPGIDRPLVRLRDFEAWAGFEAKLKLRETVDGRRRFRGLIEGFEDNEVRLKVKLDERGDEQVLGFPVALIEEAKLVKTDELLTASLAGSPLKQTGGQSSS